MAIRNNKIMTTETPRSNKRLTDMVEYTYEKSLFSCDHGMWTVFEVVKRPLFQAPSENIANSIIADLTKIRSLKNT